LLPATQSKSKSKLHHNLLNYSYPRLLNEISFEDGWFRSCEEKFVFVFGGSQHTVCTVHHDDIVSFSEVFARGLNGMN
jgi:hypothetical protein